MSTYFGFMQGREKLVRMVTGKSISVREGTHACTNENVMYLPVPKRRVQGLTHGETEIFNKLGLSTVIKDGEVDQLQRLIYDGKAFHESAHHCFKSDFEQFKDIQRTHPHGQLMARLVNITDDVRVETLFQREYKGSLETIRKYWQWKDLAVLPDLDQVAGGDEVSLVSNVGVLFIAKCRAKTLGVDLTYTPKDAKTLEVFEKYYADLVDAANAAETFQDSIDLANILYERIKSMLEDEHKEQDQNGQQGSDPQGDEGEDNQSSPGDSSGQDSDDNESSEKSGEGDDGQGSGSESSDSEESDTGSSSKGEDRAGDDSTGESAEDSSGEGDAEGEAEGSDPQGESGKESPVAKALNTLNDNAKRLESPEDAVTQKLNQEADKTAYVVDPSITDSIGPAPKGSINAAQRAKQEGIKMLGKAGRDMVRHFITNTKPHTVRRVDRGRLDVRTFVGNRYSNNVYTHKVKGSLETAALAIALDNSYSMIDYGRDFIASSLISGLLYYCDKAGIPTLAAGYTMDGRFAGWGSEQCRTYPVRIDVIKDFEERYSSEVMQRAVPLDVDLKSGTPDLDALRWMVPKLMQRKESKKVLFVICDGQPTADNRALATKLVISYKRYIEEAKKAGIRLFGLGIKQDLSYFFGDDCVTVTEQTLSNEFVAKLKVILNS